MLRTNKFQTCDRPVEGYLPYGEEDQAVKMHFRCPPRCQARSEEEYKELKQITAFLEAQSWQLA